MIKRIKKIVKKSRKRKITVVILIVLIVTISCYWYFVVCFNMLKFTQIKGMEEYCQFSGYNKGENVKIAVLDSGVNANHQDLSENIKEGYDVRRHIVGGTYRTLISVQNPLRLCRTGICRSLSAG